MLGTEKHFRAVVDEWQLGNWRRDDWKYDSQHSEGWQCSYQRRGEWQREWQWNDAWHDGYWRWNGSQSVWQYSEFNSERSQKLTGSQEKGRVLEKASRVEVIYRSEHIRRLVNAMYDKETTIEILKRKFACKEDLHGHKDRWCIVASHTLGFSFEVYPSLIENCVARGREGLLLVGRRGWRKQGPEIFDEVLKQAVELLVSAHDER